MSSIRDFVFSLSEKDVRRELLRAYTQMERCKEVLSGKDTEPVEMMDNGESTDMELFYTCKKKAEEIALLEEQLRGECAYTMSLDGNYTDTLVQYVRKQRNKQHKYHIHDTVYYMYFNTIKYSKVSGVELTLTDGYQYKTECGDILRECDMYSSVEDLLEKLKKGIQ